MLVVIAAACFNSPGIIALCWNIIYQWPAVWICTSTSRLERPQQNDVPERTLQHSHHHPIWPFFVTATLHTVDMLSLLDTHQITRGRKLTVGVALFCSGRPRCCCHIQDISIITLIWAGTDDFKFVRHSAFPFVPLHTSLSDLLMKFCIVVTTFSNTVLLLSFLFLYLTAWSRGYLANSQDCLHRSKELCKMTNDSLWWCSGQSALLMIDSKHKRGCAIEFTVFMEELESVFVWSVSLPWAVNCTRSLDI